LSFVALDVNAGSWLEPYEVPGLAHFLEHMEFINSKSYNETNYLDDFLSNNGGFSNAFTVEDHTNYFYSVTPGSLSESLLRFSHLFVDPVFLKESVDKESSAVNSEYLFDINSDPWKVENLLSLLTDSNHPFSRFSIGNTATLRDDPPKKGLDVTEELKKFHDSYYSANLMSLVVYS
jgi:insulysin